MKAQTSTLRSFLFLQGPHGAFFPKLGAALTVKGHSVTRINFNGGDRATWGGAYDYMGTESYWPAFIQRFLSDRSITDLVLFGDSRPKHVVAIDAAHARGLRVHVFEEGYIRPDWVTLERSGVNGNSLLPRDPQWYVSQARFLAPVPKYEPIPSFGTARGWGAFFYYAEVVLQFWRFPFHKTHRPRDPVLEGLNFLWRITHRKGERALAEQAAQNLIGVEYMLFPLQLNSDYQIRLHSCFGTMRNAIIHVLESFARHAPATMRLAIKEHPLDSGLSKWRKVIAEDAGRLGIADRVDFLEHGDLLELLRASRGVVTVNSTSGTLALAEGVPVVVLGSAVYDIAGITHQSGLDSFWTVPEGPTTEVYDAFYRVLVDRCLLHGAFLSQVGIDFLIAGAVQRLTRADRVEDQYPATLAAQ